LEEGKGPLYGTQNLKVVLSPGQEFKKGFLLKEPQ